MEPCIPKLMVCPMHEVAPGPLPLLSSLTLGDAEEGGRAAVGTKIPAFFSFSALTAMRPARESRVLFCHGINTGPGGSWFGFLRWNRAGCRKASAGKYKTRPTDATESGMEYEAQG